MMRALLPLLLALTGCATSPVSNPNLIQPLTQIEYEMLINKHTRRTNQYSGFYQTFQADMTILNTEVLTATLRQRGHFLQWDQRQYQAERDKVMQEASAYSRFFMRFYSPENDYDDLHKGKTIWRVYLEAQGSRFEGKVKKITDKFVEVQNVYPHMDRFSSPYEITFSVPMTTVENQAAKVILTSSLGTAEFQFPGVK
ncbi:MAG TPA: hypothetical protein PKC28_06130 [Bdellovibrionales bacterium]|nr:hypothetical protein [Bdellovibrionales bacterium]